MSLEEHLYENILELVKKHGPYHFTAKDAQKIKDEEMVQCVECASVESIGHLIGMANYVVQCETFYCTVEEDPLPFSQKF